MHVLSTPPAFVLSQDQTLQKKQTNQKKSTPPADQRLIAEGDEPVVFELLGLRNAWSLPYHVRSVFAWHELADLSGAFWPPRGGDLIVASERESTRILLPEHPTRPAAVFLGEFLHASLDRKSVV